jgi:hypothetical protein
MKNVIAINVTNQSKVDRNRQYKVEQIHRQQSFLLSTDLKGQTKATIIFIKIHPVGMKNANDCGTVAIKQSFCRPQHQIVQSLFSGLNEFLSPYKQLKGHRSKNKKKGMLSNGV